MHWKGPVFRRWAGFSFSETRPLFWILLGPFLMMLTLTLAVPTFSNLCLSLGAIIGSMVSCKRGKKVFGLTLFLLLTSFALTVSFSKSSLSAWQIGWGGSLILGLVICFLSIEQVKSDADQKNAERERSLKAIQLAKQKTLIEKQALEREVEVLKKNLTDSHEEAEVLSNLVEATRVESDKLEKRVQLLSLQLIESERELETLRDSLRNAKQTLKTAEKESTQASFKMGEELVPSQPEGEEKYLILKTLEKNKSRIKKAYDQSLKDYKKILGDIQQRDRNLQKIAMKRGNKKDRLLEVDIADKQKELERAKSELIGIERAIFMIKKELQGQQALAR